MAISNAVRGFFHTLGQRWVRVHVARNFARGQVKALRKSQLWQQLGNIGTCLLYTSDAADE